jgi:hypothetical protein
MGLKMFVKTDESYLVLAVGEGTVDVAVDTFNFMDFQLLQQHNALTSIVSKLASG